MEINTEEIWLERKRSALRYLARKLIGSKDRVIIIDGEKPYVKRNKYLETEISIPIKDATIASFIFGKSSSKKIALIDADIISSALLMHEIAHVINKEPFIIDKRSSMSYAFKEFSELIEEEKNNLLNSPDTVPTIVTNLINDVNDFTFIPSTWRWATPYMQYLSDLYTFSKKLYTKKRVDSNLTEKEKKEKQTDYAIELNRAIQLYITYMRTLRFVYDKRITRNIDKDDRLYEDSIKIKEIVRTIRVPWATYETRVKASIDLDDLLMDIWIRNGGPTREDQQNQTQEMNKIISEIISKLLSQVLEEMREEKNSNFEEKRKLPQKQMRSLFLRPVTEKEFNYEKALLLSYIRKQFDGVNPIEALFWFEGFIRSASYAPLYTADPIKNYQYFEQLTWRAFEKTVKRIQEMV